MSQVSHSGTGGTSHKARHSEIFPNVKYKRSKIEGIPNLKNDLQNHLLSFMKRGGSAYIMTNKRHSVLYTGVSADLSIRAYQHKEKTDPTCFTAKYNCDLLVYYISFHHIEEAIAEEKRIKGLSRSKKLDLIFKMNPLWKDLYDTLED